MAYDSGATALQGAMAMCPHSQVCLALPQLGTHEKQGFIFKKIKGDR
jgi:hypothetical protein